MTLARDQAAVDEDFGRDGRGDWGRAAAEAGAMQAEKSRGKDGNRPGTDAVYTAVQCGIPTEREGTMRFVGFSLAVVGLSSLMLSVVVAHAVLGPVSQAERRAAVSDKARTQIPAWTTVVTRETE
jgi:hypothetical protein